MIGAGLIVAADLVDEFFKDHKFIIAKIIAVAAAAVVGIKYVLKWLSGERNLSTMGSRGGVERVQNRSIFCCIM